MRPKRKLKKGVKIFFTLIVLSLIAFGIYHFNLIDYAKEFFTVKEGSKEKEKKKEEEKPKLKIFDENSKSRAIAVSVNNNKAAWPHSGLGDAFITYEVIAEGGITRLIALYKDKETEKIGSVRSARHYFLDYVLENDAIFVHYGHSPQALSDIKNLSINNINGMYDATGFWRDTSSGKSFEHTAFTSMEKIKGVIQKKNYRTSTEKSSLLKYSISPLMVDDSELSQKADKVSIEYSSYQTTSYEYDEESQVYKLFMGGKPHIDAVTKEQYTVKNIITYKVDNVQLDSKGRQELKNIGTGSGYFITNGYAVPITWSKESRSAQTKYFRKGGEELYVNDGNTWIHIQPKTKSFKIEKIEEPSSTAE